MHRRIEMTVLAHVVLATTLVVTGGGSLRPNPAWIVAVAAMVAVVGAWPCHIELRRSTYDFTLTEAVLVGVACQVGAAEVVLGFALGEAVACRLYPLPWSKTWFNAAQQASASAVGVVAFVAVAGTSGSAAEPRTWLAGLAAAAAAVVASNLSTAWMVARAERSGLLGVVASAAPAAIATAVAASSLGLLARLVIEQRPVAVVLLLPVVVLVLSSARHMARAQADALRFRRLYEASSRVGRLDDLDAVLGGLAAEAAQLATGTVSVCCTVDDDGRWWGVRSADGQHSAIEPALAVWLAAQSGEVQVAPGDCPDSAVELFGVDGVLLVTASSGSPDHVLVAVGREHGHHDDADTALEVLQAFAGTCSLVLANARLFVQVNEALSTQLDLNRQKADFVAAVSHELRTPLAVMLCSVQAVRRFGERIGNADRDQLLTTAEGGGQRLQRLIDDLLFVASAEHREAESIAVELDLVTLVGEVADEARAAGSAECVIMTHGAGPAKVRTDPEKVRRILLNLVENAGKYAPGAPVELSVGPIRGGLGVVVADHGPGIDPADRERVFEPFVQLDQSSTRHNGGTGLGLHLCRTMAAAMDAQLLLTDRADGGPGAAFTMVLAPVPAGNDPAPASLAGVT